METFKTTLEKADDSVATAIYVPEDIVKKLDSKKRIPVKVEIDGIAYRSTIVHMHGHFLIPVNKGIRDQIKKNGGETVSVKLSKDSELRVIEIPSTLKKQMEAAGILEKFNKLSFTHQKEYVQWIDEAKKQETRERRIAKMIEMIGTDQKKA
ncbi:MAG: DUF1905 domain-containing protein [Calditrichaeota bacterium]|nr:DUF1905 domain-containing protein [Calditrichota bacterium]